MTVLKASRYRAGRTSATCGFFLERGDNLSQVGAFSKYYPFATESVVEMVLPFKEGSALGTCWWCGVSGLCVLLGMRSCGSANGAVASDSSEGAEFPSPLVLKQPAGA